MAKLAISLTTGTPRPKRIGRGLKMLQGTMCLSTTANAPTSVIEKYFRKCYDINIQIESGFMVKYKGSTVNRNGQVFVYCGSTTGVSALANTALTAITSGTFTAFGT